MVNLSKSTERRVAAAFAALALAVAAPAAFAASTSNHQTVVHTHIDRNGTIVVTGYDGGAPLAPTP
jgi:ABC-type sugar transport system substrate-binding protein